MNRLAPVLLALALGACGTQAPRPAALPERAEAPSLEKAPTPVPRRGGYYLDDGPGDAPPADLSAIPDAVPKAEPLHRFANNPYSALGRDYVPMREAIPYRARGIASWYGRRYHGQKTSSGEPYDMYGMTAAHPTLPIPSYARVTNSANGKSVIVRINDRGPFHSDRIIDLSYTAAWKLGYVNNGSALVEVENILPGAGVVEEGRGVYLQLGAFGNPENAESFLARVALELGWLSGKLVKQAVGGIHRVQAGPYPDRVEAEGVAERIRTALGVRPALVVR